MDIVENPMQVCGPRDPKAFLWRRLRPRFPVIRSIPSSRVSGVAISSTLMILHNALQPLRDLDRTSPEFHEQLAAFLRGNEYQNIFPTLQSEDLIWLVEYLDSVSSADLPLPVPVLPSDVM